MIAAGQDLSALREQVRPKLRAALAAATSKLERTGQTTWTFGTIPKVVALPGTGQTDARVPVAGRRGRRPSACARWRARRRSALNMRVGTRRLLALTIPSPLRQYQGEARQRRAARADGGAARVASQAVLEDAATAAISALMTEAGGPVCDEASLRRACATTSPATPPTRSARIIADVVRILQAAREVRQRAGRAARRGAGRRAHATSPSRSAGSSSPASSPRPARAGCRTSSATCAAPRGGSSGCTKARRRRPRPHARDPRARGPLPAAGSRSCPPGARRRRAGRGAVAARGAADQPVRAGDRPARARSSAQAHPPHPRRGRPSTRPFERRALPGLLAPNFQDCVTPHLETHDRFLP